MRRTISLLFTDGVRVLPPFAWTLLAAALGASIFLVSNATFGVSVAGAKEDTGSTEEPLPDLRMELRGPTTAQAEDLVFYYNTVINTGLSGAVVTDDTVLARSSMNRGGQFTTYTEKYGSRYCLLVGGPSEDERGIMGVGLVEFDYQYGCQSTVSPPDTIHPGGTRPDDKDGSKNNWYSVGTRVNPERAGGVVTYCVTADPDNKIPESNETNNTKCLFTNIGNTKNSIPQ